MGLFVNIKVNQTCFSSAPGREIVANTCPVDIFFVEGDVLAVHPEVEDECTFCYLCLQNSPPGAIHIEKTYQDWLDNLQT